jgi:single-strand DNA-binding protein
LYLYILAINKIIKVMSFNKVILIGNVGKDPEIRRFENNIKASFSLATSETYTPKGGEKVTQTEWHNIVCWRRLAEISESYIKKGSQLLVEGKLRYRSYDDRDGNKRYVVEVEADNIQLLGRKSDGTSSAGQQTERFSGGTGTQNSPNQGNQGQNQFNNGNSEPPTEDFSAQSADDLPF